MSDTDYSFTVCSRAVPVCRPDCFDAAWSEGIDGDNLTAQVEGQALSASLQSAPAAGIDGMVCDSSSERAGTAERDQFCPPEFKLR